MSQTSESFNLTTPLYYVNAEPHIGSAYTNIISDCICRFWRLYGRGVSLLTGVDEHGGKIENTAKANNLQPQEHCDLIALRFEELWQKLNIKYEYFSRTSSEKHNLFVKTFFEKVWQKGDIYEAEYKGLYCLACEDFKIERDLLEGNLCPVHKTKVQEYSEKNYFFALSKYTEQISKFLDENPDFVQPSYRLEEVKGWLKEGLKDFPISRRSVSWGIPVPNDPTQTIYVWFDALLGYFSPIIKNTSSLDELKNFTGYTHIVGKDILRFHAVYWLGMLMSAELPLPKKIFGHGFLTKDGQKMGKSTGNTIDPYDLIDRFSDDAVRFYFIFNIPFGLDGDYTESVFIESVNAYLANRLGNLFSRVLNLIEKNMNGNIPEDFSFNSNSRLAELSLTLPEKVKERFEKFETHEALAEIFKLIDELNLNLTDIKPWNLFKTGDSRDRKLAENTLVETLESLRVISNLLEPFMPSLATKTFDIFGQKEKALWKDICTWGLLNKNKRYEKSVNLFDRIELTKSPK